MRRRLSESEKRDAARTRQQIIALLGGQCECCGERGAAFLQIDHVLEDGAAERSSKADAVSYYAGILERVAAGAVDRYRCLCSNCNGASFRKRRCPHDPEDLGRWFHIQLGVACAEYRTVMRIIRERILREDETGEPAIFDMAAVMLLSHTIDACGDALAVFPRRSVDAAARALVLRAQVYVVEARQRFEAA